MKNAFVLRDSRRAFSFLLGLMLGFFVFTNIFGYDHHVTHAASKRKVLSLKEYALIKKSNEKINGSWISNKEEDSEKYSFLKTRVLCWVPVRDGQSEEVKLIRSSWGSHCDLLVFTSSVSYEPHNVIGLPNLPKIGRDLWNIVHPGWQYLADTFLNDFDWFVKVDDDSYFSTHNFKYMVRNYNSSDLHYLGHTQYHHGPRNLFNLGAGYAVSRETLRRASPYFPNRPENFKEKCHPTDTWAEDAQFAHCLRQANVGNPTNSRDSKSRETFNLFPPVDTLTLVRRPDSSSWVWNSKPKEVG